MYRESCTALRTNIIQVKEFLKHIPDPECPTPCYSIDRIDLNYAITQITTLKNHILLLLETYNVMKTNNKGALNKDILEFE